MRILLICLGNICRSPTAEAALREALAEGGLDGQVQVDSAGTGDWHVGQPPDQRMTAAASAVGLRLSGKARRILRGDFESADLILVMDRANLRDVLALAPTPEARDKVRLFREFDPDADGLEVPDPYYGGPEGYKHVVTITRSAARGLVRHLQQQELFT
ncbi:MAG: low molecular weight protein-tyrosine-phosphatase [Egibacteraceae bacterium]